MVIGRVAADFNIDYNDEVQVKAVLEHIGEVYNLAHYHHNLDALVIYNDFKYVYDKMPRRYQWTIHHKFFLQLRNDEIARRLNSSLSNVSQRISRATKYFITVFKDTYS